MRITMIIFIIETMYELNKSHIHIWTPRNFNNNLLHKRVSHYASVIFERI